MRRISIGVAGLFLLLSFICKASCAADRPRQCCEDLEERIADLEASITSKGTRNVSLTLSGWVNEAVFFWDDSVEENVYVGTNDLERTRFRAIGEARISSDVVAGYTIEVGVRGANSSQFSQTSTADVHSVDLRKSSWFLSSKTLGRLTLGQDGTATYHLLDDADVTKTRNTSDYEAAGVYIGQFRARQGNSLSLTWRSLMGGFNNVTPGQSGRRNVVRYDTPAVKSWSAAAAWGEDDMWDVGLFWKPNLEGFKAAVRLGYGESTDPRANDNRCAAPGNGDCAWWGIGASLQHSATGLFIYGAYGAEHVGGIPEPFEDLNETEVLQAGLERTWIALGSTTVFAEARHDEAGLAAPATALDGSRVLSSSLDFYSLGIIQAVDAAAMDAYLLYRHADGEAVTALGTTDFEPFVMVITGARITY